MPIGAVPSIPSSGSYWGLCYPDVLFPVSVVEGECLPLLPELFSRKLLGWLYEQGAFDTAYNRYDGEEDYEFMLTMFNKRNKDLITPKQHKKIKGILLNSIRPFLERRLSEKVR